MQHLTRRITVAAFAFTLTYGIGFAAGPNVKNRQVRQQNRIRQGVGSDELNRRETLRLERNAVRIHKSVLRDRRDGGVFTPRERKNAQQKLQKQSKAIYKQKHDGQQR